MILQLHHEPAVLVLTRQAVPTLDRTKYGTGIGAGARRLCAGGRSRAAILKSS